MILAPSILAADFTKLGEQVKLLEQYGVQWLHIDVMDGHFVPNISIGAPVVRSLRPITKMYFDVHLMIEEPEKYIDDFALAGADMITVHYEATKHLNRCIQKIKAHKIHVGVALNPATSIVVLESILEEVDMVLLMTVNPGFGGQAYIESSTHKIESLAEIINKRKLNTKLQVDGGIGPKNIKEVTEAGANVVVAGSSIFGATDIKQAIEQLMVII